MNRQRWYQSKCIFLVMLVVVATWTPTLAQQPQKPGIEPIWLDFDMETIPEPKQVDTGYRNQSLSLYKTVLKS